MSKIKISFELSEAQWKEVESTLDQAIAEEQDNIEVDELRIEALRAMAVGIWLKLNKVEHAVCPECQNNPHYITQDDSGERCYCRTCGGPCHEN